MLDDGSWLDVPSRPGSLVLNLGVTLSNMTSGRIKATEHRVREIGRERYSVPFFFEPGYHAQVPLHLPLENIQHMSLSSISDLNLPGNYQYGAWMMTRSKQFVEYRALTEEQTPHYCS